MRCRTILMTTLLLSGFAAGILTGTGEGRAALYEYDVRNFPGPTYSPTTINCGWHDNCDQRARGANGLDWRNWADYDVYWRSWSANESNQS